MSANSESFPPPNNPDDFESLCLDLWKEIWRDPGANRNGRSGQPQAGVDVYGRQDGQWMGVQCKQKDGLLRRKVTRMELETEVKAAEEFKPPLTSFILATTGPADVRVQQRARELTDEHRAKGLFTIEVWSWEKIWHEIYGREELLRFIGPVYWSRYWKLIEERLRPESAHGISGVHGLLVPWEFEPFLREKSRDFTGREWLFDEIDEWLRNGNEKALLITGDPGAGKSAVAAALVRKNSDGQVLAYHCCQADTKA